MIKKIFPVILLGIIPLSFEKFTNKDVRVAKCTGKDTCLACSNCSQCKYCSGNNYCGACKVKAQPLYNTKKSTPDTGQCRATTKKGARCSKNVTNGKYCWQHHG